MRLTLVRSIVQIVSHAAHRENFGPHFFSVNCF